MNENPEGTPNPLNPTPEATPTEATPAPAEPVAAQEEKAPEEKAPEEKPATETATAAAAETVVSSEKPAGKKKTGLIVGLVILVLALIGGGVAAAMLLGGGGGGDADGVSKAIIKLLSGDFSKKATTKGTVTVSSSNSDIPFETISADLNIGYDADTNVSSGYANISATLTDGSTVKAKVDEVFKDKKLYFNVTGTDDGTAVTNCTNDTTDNCAPTGMGASINMVINQLSGNWISVPVEEMMGSTSIVPSNDTTKCLTKAIQDESSEGIDLAGIYKENEFVKYTTEGVKITKKKSPVYKLTFDADKLAGFANNFSKSLKDSSAAKCMDITSTEEVTGEDLSEMISAIPPVYAEVNGDNEFSRLYVVYAIDEANLEIKLDLEFDYKASVDATVPANSTDITTLLSGFGGGSLYDDDDDWDYDDDDWDFDEDWD
ncbi:hypothetical protein IJS18_02475 [Candidatus Saccharibacteria bacterium]|nr:hypothetical protein [Candidatus Saccharibacteria bacterium]